MTQPNTIQTPEALRVLRSRIGDSDIQGAQAMAAVDALYQAAKPLEDYFTELDDYSISLSDGRVDDLRDSIVEIARAVAAAVRRVDGEA